MKLLESGRVGISVDFATSAAPTSVKFLPISTKQSNVMSKCLPKIRLNQDVRTRPSSLKKVSNFHNSLHSSHAFLCLTVPTPGMLTIPSGGPKS